MRTNKVTPKSPPLPPPPCAICWAYGAGYPLGQVGSAVQILFSPSSSCIPSLLGGTMWEREKALMLCKNYSAIVETSLNYPLGHWIAMSAIPAETCMPLQPCASHRVADFSMFSPVKSKTTMDGLTIQVWDHYLSGHHFQKTAHNGTDFEADTNKVVWFFCLFIFVYTYI